MTFVVEDGTGLSNSNSYTDLTFANDYFSDRGVTAWSGSDAEKQSWLVQATDYVEGRFGAQFFGYPKTDEQALSWPRVYAGKYADNVVPIALEKAVCEYALRAMTAALAPDPKYSDSGVVTVVASEKVGPLETSYQVLSSGTGSTISAFRPYPAADMLLSGLLRQTGGRVIR